MRAREIPKRIQIKVVLLRNKKMVHILNNAKKQLTKNKRSLPAIYQISIRIRYEIRRLATSLNTGKLRNRRYPDDEEFELKQI